jgi:predicted MPP superfamily phosphohydrolase
LGSYAILGNHDNPAPTAKAFAHGPVRLLVDERIEIGPLQIVGADSIQRGSPAVEAMRHSIGKAKHGKPLLVIVHEPVFFTWLYPARPVLMIAGHTHGGQVNLPLLGAIMLPTDFYRSHRRGVFREGVHTLLVSSGLGTTNLPIRIGVPPEIVELTLLPAQPGRNSGTDK